MHKKKLKTKVFALLFALCMVSTYMPSIAFAADADPAADNAVKVNIKKLI